MKSLIFLISTLLLSHHLYAQLKPVTDTSYLSWNKVEAGAISADGKYVKYTLRPLDDRSESTVVISSADKKWERRFTGLRTVSFSSNGHDLFGIADKKLIHFFPGSDRTDTIGNCGSYETFLCASSEYLGFINTGTGSLLIKNLKTGRLDSIPNVVSFWKNPVADEIIFKRITSESPYIEEMVKYDLHSKREIRFYEGAETDNILINNAGTALAFTTSVNGITAIWHANLKSAKSDILINDQNLGTGLQITQREIWKFSLDDTALYFTTEANPELYMKDELAPDIWSYEDKMVYPQFKKRGYQITGYINGRNLCSVTISTKKFTSILGKGESIKYDFPAQDFTRNIGNYVVIQTTDSKQSRITEATKTSYYLLNLKDLSRKPLKMGTTGGIWNNHVSPDQRHVIYFDLDSQSWFNYRIQDSSTTRFAESISKELYAYHENRRQFNNYAIDVIGWIAGTDRLVMQGHHDIYDVEINNKQLPVNLTSTVPTSSKKYAFCARPPGGIINARNDLYIYSLDDETKGSALYKMNISKKKFSQVYAGDFYWNRPFAEIPPTFFQKASSADAYLFLIGNSATSPNYFFTTDFEKIIKISSNYPEQAYQWFTGELHTYKDSEGNSCQGVLYKPKNFDSTKKYPVLFTIYEESASTLNRFKSPEPVGTQFNLPVMLSKGYLVFDANMYIRQGQVGEMALKSINAAVDHLLQYHWVDSTKLALSGHSHGGLETNYIITSSNRFAAALANAGVSSVLSEVNELWGSDQSEKSVYVTGHQPYICSTPEKDLDVYIRNSPIIHAKNVQTPLLLMHNPNDLNVKFEQSVQMFVQLRRLGKPVWLVSYPNEGHVISKIEHQLDWQRKIASFFDYYLMGKEKPDWMTQHIDF